MKDALKQKLLNRDLDSFKFVFKRMRERTPTAMREYYNFYRTGGFRRPSDENLEEAINKAIEFLNL